MLISIITVCYNSEKTIRATIVSVLKQDYADIEYIIIDGSSTDNTLKIINEYKDKINIIISEKDEGLYDAMNKGIKIANGNIIGTLNSDDYFYSNSIISNIAKTFLEHKNLDAVYGNIIFKKNNNFIRQYSSNNWNKYKFEFGYMPAHPSFYCKKHLYEKYGYYRKDFKIAADFELLIRFFRIQNISYIYINEFFVIMNYGGNSTKGLLTTIKINKEIKYACNLNGLNTNYLKLYLRYFIKMFEFI